MSDCLFCKFVNKDLETDVVYENDKVLAFLDIYPINLGHVLIVPKKHFVNIYDIDSEYLKEIIAVSQKIALAYKKVFGIDNCQLFHSAGEHGQQEVFHFHLHLVPRAEGDGQDMRHVRKTELRGKFSDFLEKLSNSKEL